MKPHRIPASVIAAAALALSAVLPALADVPGSPWVARDVGSPTPPGSTDVDAAGIWTLRGSGMDIWGDADQFHYVSQRLRGDGSISARFLSMEGGDATWVKTGLMIRDDDTPGSPHLLYAMSSGPGLIAQARFQQDTPMGDFGLVGLKTGKDPNLFMRLQRAGQEISGFYSRDGVVWFQAGFGPIVLPGLKEEAQFGLALTSHKDGSLATVRFDQVGAQPGALLPYGLSACGGDRSVLLQWRPVRDAVGYVVYRGTKDATRDQLVKLTAVPLAGTSFADSSGDLVNGTPVQYAVASVFRAADGTVAEGPPAALFGTPIAVPQGLIGCSINEGPAPGLAVFDAVTGEITVRGSGNDIWISGDQCYFLHVPVEGDVQVTVRFLSKHSGAQNGKPAGLMIRETLDPGARNVFIGPLSTVGLFRQWRLNVNDWTFGAPSILDAAYKAPSVLRLTRRGDTIFPEFSTDDGKTFQKARAITFPSPLARTLYVGVAVSSGTRTSASSIRFRDLEIRKP